MARLWEAGGFQPASRPAAKPTSDSEATTPMKRPSRRRPAIKYAISDDEDDEDDGDIFAAIPTDKQAVRPVVKAKPQVRLAPLKSLQSFSDLTIQDDTPEKGRRRLLTKEGSSRLLQRRVSPRKKIVREPSPSQGPAKKGLEEPEEDEHVDEEANIEESIWCGSDASSSDSEADLPSPSTFFPARRKVNADNGPPDLSTQLQALRIFDEEPEQERSKNKNARPSEKQLERLGNSSDKENGEAVIRFFPPRFGKPIETGVHDRSRTPPPASPTKSRLQSPSKRAPRVPIPPMRPSLDAFWTADAVNGWNDTHSPQKPLRSPAKKLFESHTAFFDDSPIPSPLKLMSPTKRTKAELQARRDWDTRKTSLAETFLAELDDKITAGQIAQLSASTGGVEIIWSKTLNSTAGRANWRRETTKSHSKSDPTKVHIVHKHFASIELASKVLTYCEDGSHETKLLNVLAHEFCHLANFMVSGIKTHPHGASFKAWGKKCSKEFETRGVEVTTKHSYEIEYKYIWQCEDVERCGMLFKRHSKSIDVKRHRCGGCKANLVQVKPVPRGVAGGTKSSSGRGTPVDVVGEKEGKAKTVNGYAAFVKENFAELKKAMVGASHKEVMEALGRKYRVEKEAKSVEVKDVDGVAKKLGEFKLDVTEVVDLTDD